MNKIKEFFAKIFPSTPQFGEIGSIKLNIWLANITGVPLVGLKNETNGLKLLILLYGVGMLTVITLFYTGFEIMDLMQNMDDLDRFTQNICLSFTHISGVLKIMNIFYRYRDFKDLLDKLQHVTKTYIKSKKQFFNVSSLSLATAMIRLKLFQIETFHKGEFENKIVLSIYMGLVCFTGLLAFIMLIYSPENIAGKAFPYSVWLPEWMPLYVELIYMGSSTLIFALQIVSIDYLNVNIINQIRFQLIILNLSFEELIVDASSPELAEVSLIKSSKHLKCIIEHHCQLREIRQRTEKIFRYPVLLQFFTSLMIFAMTGFQATVRSGSGSIDVLIYFYCGCIFCQLFVYCWFGNEVFEQSKTLATSGYNSSWCLYDQQFGRSILIFLTNAQRPFVFTAGGFMGLSLPSFAGILSKSYSYIALLRQIYGR